MDNPTRRAFLRVGVAGAALAACSPAVTSPSAPAQRSPAAGSAPQTPDWQRQWDELVAAANREGALALVTTPGTGLKENVEAFQKAFPPIKVDYTSMIASQFVPRAIPELQAGVRTYDVMTSSYSGTTAGLLDGNFVDPVKSILIRPDVLDKAAWQNGFDAGWRDKDKQFIYGPFQVKSRYLWINTDIVKEDEIKRVEDLLNPKWKGQILSGDPRNYGYGVAAASAMRIGLNDDTIVKRLWKDQEAVLSRDIRQLAEFMFKGKYAIGIGAMHPPLIPEYFSQGLGKNLKYVEVDHVETTFSGLSCPYLFKGAPHPNAARLFINWMLTKEGSTIWSAGAQENSRRVDVAPVAPEYTPKPGKTYLETDTPDGIAAAGKTQALARAALD